MTDKKVVNTDELAVQNLMRTPDGRKYMYNKLQGYGVFDNIFDNDPIPHAYQSGKRAAGLELEQDLKEYALEYYLKMLTENL